MPYVSPELIEYLEGLYQDRAPSLTDEDRKIWFKAGQVDLVRHLRSIHEEQTETSILGN